MLKCYIILLYNIYILILIKIMLFVIRDIAEYIFEKTILKAL